MPRHPEIGARLWLESGSYYRISKAILSHHENYDGPAIRPVFIVKKFRKLFVFQA